MTSDNQINFSVFLQSIVRYFLIVTNPALNYLAATLRLADRFAFLLNNC